MATVKSTTYTAQEDGKMSLSQGVAFSSLKVISGEYEAAAAASGTVIDLCKLPKGAVIHDVILDTDALGTDVTLKAGDGADDDRYIGATAAATAVQLKAGVNKGYRIGQATGDDLITATVGGAAATGTIHFTVYFA